MVLSFREHCWYLSLCVHYTRTIRGNPWNNIMEVLSTSLEKGLAALAKLYNFTRRRKLLSVLLYLACKSADLGGRVVFWEHTMFLSVQL